VQNQHPTKIGKYEVRRQLGKGTMGIVYEAYDPFVQRTVAIKVANPASIKDPASRDEYLRAFFKEVHTAGQMQHPQVASVYDAGTDGELSYIVMEYVEGETLKAYVNGEKTLSIEKAIDVAFQCCKGLEYIHKRGVIHRDVKPGNIMLTPEGDVKIMDFSIAHAQRVDGDAVAATEAKGSPMYMPPEQVQSEKRLVPASDVYSLGAVMYEMLARRPLFRANSLESLIYQIVNIDPDPLEELRPDLPQEIVDIVNKALQKIIYERYEFAAELAADLSRAFASLRAVEQTIGDREKWSLYRRLSFFREFTDDQIGEVFEASDLLHLPEAEIVVTEGEVDNSFYIIIEGEVEVIKNGLSIGRMGEGDCFGEIAYLTRRPRTATIVSSRPVTLMKISGALLDRASLETQLQYYKVFVEKLVGRLSERNARLAHRT
jgi:serine/threonine protein kinase